MITNLDPASELFLSNVERIQDRIAAATRQISSGRRITQPSDAPDQIDSLLQLHADRQRNSQIRSNLGYEQTYARSADDALTGAIKLMDEARTLASQGANSLTSAANMQSLADQAQTLLDRMVAYSQTSVQGLYIFGGDQGRNPSYQMDATSATGVARLADTTATRRVEDPAGGSFQASMSAQDIFDHRNADDTIAGDNVFAALNNLKNALASGDLTAVTNSQQGLKDAADRLNASQAFYGGLQNRVKDSIDYAESYDIELQTQLSQKEDADIVSAALEMTQGGTQLQAAFQSRAMIPRKSLFEYL